MTGGSARGRLFRFGWEHRLRDDPAVKGRAQEALLVMATFADPDGTLDITEERVAQCLVKDVRTARRAIDEARETGYLERLVRGHNVPGKTPTPSRYRLTLPRPADVGQVDEADRGTADGGTGQPDTADRLRVVGERGDDTWMSA